MIHNDVLRRTRFALNLPDSEVRRLCGLVGEPLSDSDLRACLAREDDPDFAFCPDWILGAFLDGLILERRGPRDADQGRRGAETLDNNGILKKLRIALELREPDLLALLKLGGMTLSSPELGALFRNRNHKNYRPCGDQVLRAFLRGLTVQRRGVGAVES